MLQHPLEELHPVAPQPGGGLPAPCDWAMESVMWTSTEVPLALTVNQVRRKKLFLKSKKARKSQFRLLARRPNSQLRHAASGWRVQSHSEPIILRFMWETAALAGGAHMHGVAVGRPQCPRRPAGDHCHARRPADAGHAVAAARLCARLCRQVTFYSFQMLPCELV